MKVVSTGIPIWDTDLPTKPCARCHGPLDGRHPVYCLDCMAWRTAEYRRKNPEKAKASQEAWKKRNPEKWQRMRRGYVLKREFGISLHDFEKMLEAQGNVCAICKGALIPWPHMDHNHATGQVREILCHHCNLAIGNVKDDPDRAEAIAAYLRRHSLEG